MPMSLPMGAVDKSPDLSPWAGKGGQTWGAQPCLSPPTSVACISFLVSSPSWSHAWPLMMIKLKLQYFGHLMGRVGSLQKTDTGRDCGQEEKGTTEDEMAGWHH